VSGLGEFLDRPGLSGSFGALMDEYARAAGELCGVIEAVPPDLFLREAASGDPDVISIQAIATHVSHAAQGYANTLRKARGLPRTPADRTVVLEPAGLRPRLAAALRSMEGALDGLYDADEAIWTALRFEMPWGPTYDPEILLEHAIVHLLRHRRQVERWPRDQ
jgi:uncharacterized damage-inducible protein DinB